MAALAVVGGLIAGPALADGPNAGGVLIVHANTGLDVSDGPTNYCGQSGLEQCVAAVPTLSGGDAEAPHACFVLAAFPKGSSPRLSGLVFGLYYSDDLVLSDFGACGDFELPNANWPASNEGTAVTWNDARTSQLVDDSVIGWIDPIAGYGALGLDTPGFAPCGEAPIDVRSWGGIKQTYR